MCRNGCSASSRKTSTKRNAPRDGILSESTSWLRLPTSTSSMIMRCLLAASRPCFSATPRPQFPLQPVLNLLKLWMNAVSQTAPVLIANGRIVPAQAAVMRVIGVSMMVRRTVLRTDVLIQRSIGKTLRLWLLPKAAVQRILPPALRRMLICRVIALTANAEPALNHAMNWTVKAIECGSILHIYVNEAENTLATNTFPPKRTAKGRMRNARKKMPRVRLLLRRWTRVLPGCVRARTRKHRPPRRLQVARRWNLSMRNLYSRKTHPHRILQWMPHPPWVLILELMNPPMQSYFSAPRPL